MVTQLLWAGINKSHSLTVWQMSGEDLKVKMKMKTKVPMCVLRQRQKGPTSNGVIPASPPSTVLGVDQHC